MQESSTLQKEVSSCRRAQLCPKRLAHAGQLNSAQRGQLMQESAALHKEVSSCSRAQLCPKRSAQFCARGQDSSAQEVSSSRRAQLRPKRSAQLCTIGQLMQESSALTKEVSLALRKRSVHPGELKFDQRGQLSSAQEVRSAMHKM